MLAVNGPQDYSLSECRPGVDDEHKIGIASFIIEWTAFDVAAELLLWRLLDMDADTGRALTSRLDLRPRLDLVRAISKLRPGKEPIGSAIKDNLPGIEGLQKLRNAVAHGRWFTLPNGDAIAMSHRLAAPTGRVSGTIIPLPVLTLAADEARALATLFQEMAEPLPPLRGTHDAPR